MEMGHPGRRAQVFERPEPAVEKAVGKAADLVPAAMRRKQKPALPEMTEFEVLRHYLHLSQMVHGMMGVNLFGTCTMKYNPRLSTFLTLGRSSPRSSSVPARPDAAGSAGDRAQLRPDPARPLRHGSVRLPGGGRRGCGLYPRCVTRGWFAAKKQLEQRNEIISTIQTHPCNQATAATAGFNVITLPLEENGYPSIEALKAALSNRTAALMVNNPDDMGVYNPQIRNG